MRNLRVLICLPDIFYGYGGGKTVYRRIIQKSPDVRFFYFRFQEPQETERPKNAHTISFVDYFDVKVLAALPIGRLQYKAQWHADRLARSVTGQSFDVVEIPDFLVEGAYLREAFEAHNVKVKKFVLALHGNISRSTELNWDAMGKEQLELKALQKKLFREFDGIYSLSIAYMREMRNCGRAIFYIDPLHFIREEFLSSSLRSNYKNKKPNILFIGRLERCKGPDIFIDQVSLLPKDCYQEAIIIGDNEKLKDGTPVTDYLRGMALRRNTQVTFEDLKDSQELMNYLSDRCIVVLPSRYDTFNLLALEVLSTGCPVIISDKAGVSQYLDEVFKEIPYIQGKIDSSCTLANNLKNLIDNYDGFREKLTTFLLRNPLKPKTDLKMKEMYESILRFEAVNLLEESSSLPLGKKRWLDSILNFLYRVTPRGYRRKIKSSAFFESKHREGPARVTILALLKDLRKSWRDLSILSRLPENTKLELKNKLLQVNQKFPTWFFRMNFLSELCRLEKLLIEFDGAQNAQRFFLENFYISNMVSKALMCRIFQFRFKVNTNVSGLRKQRLLTNVTESNSRCATGDSDENLSCPKCPKLSIIVVFENSSYEKAQFSLLELLRNQSVLKKGNAEVIVVGVGLNSNLKAFFEHQAKNYFSKLEVTYIGSNDNRFGAWNSGIKSSKGKYLKFLNANDRIFPDSLEKLLSELDQSSDIDWVFGSEIIFEADKFGRFNRDVFLRRPNFEIGEEVCLDDTFIYSSSGMYRKSLHDKYGLFDENCKIFGPLDFFMRILPKIKVKFLPDLSVCTELILSAIDISERSVLEGELLQSFFVYHEKEGVEFMFRNRSIFDIENQIVGALNFRRDNNERAHTNLHYALNLLNYLGKINPSHAWFLKITPGVKYILGQSKLFSLRSTSDDYLLTNFKALYFILRLKIYEWYHGRILGGAHRLKYSLPNIQHVIAEPQLPNNYCSY